MYDIIKNKITNMNNGLLLIDAPTGYGKTTFVLKYIMEKLDNMSNVKRIFFVTNLKKNLPIKEFRSSIGKDRFDNECLFLMSYAECLYEKWDSIKIDNDKITNSDEYILLNLHIKQMKSSENSGDIKLFNVLKRQLEESIEPEFRKFFKKELFSSDRYELRVAELNKNSWLKELYPITEIEKYKVIFCSTNKFFNPFDCFYKMPYEVYNNSLIDDSIIFIDEFDETKKVLLNNIIDDGLKVDIDIISLFVNIYYALENIVLPRRLLKLSSEQKERFDGNKNLKKPDEIIKINKELFSKIYEKYKLQFLSRTKGIDDERAFLFSDGNYITITSNSDRKKLITYIDEDENMRLIEAVSRKNKKEELQDMIEEIEYAINHFLIGVVWIAENYCSYKHSLGKAESKYYFFEESIRSVLSIFNINENYYEFLLSLISKKDKFREEDSLFKTGISIMSIENSEYHDIQSKVNMYRFKTTPEEIILKICRKTKVIGISATATLKTILGNYDLRFLKDKLKTNFYELSEKEKGILSNNFKNRQKMYNDVNVICKIIDNYATYDDKEKCKKLIEKVFSDVKKQEKYKKYLDSLNNLYYLLTILKIAYAYNDFVNISN